MGDSSGVGKTSGDGLGSDLTMGGKGDGKGMGSGVDGKGSWIG